MGHKTACPYCGAMNNNTNELCFACGKRLKEDPAAISAPTSAAAPTPAFIPEPEVTIPSRGVSLSKEIEAVNRQTMAEESIEEHESIKLLKQLAKLHDAGILTDEEFTQKKADLLAKM